MTALDDISFTVSRGETVFIAGENGSGKTTLLRILAGLLIPDAGQVDIPDKTPLYITAQERQFYERITGYENLRFLARLSRVPISNVKPAAIGAGLAPEKIDVPVWQYSSGMKLKLALARIGFSRTHIALLDEPTRSLDGGSRKQLIKLLAAAKAAGTAIIVTGHDPELARSCDRTIFLRRGRIDKIVAGSAEAELTAEFESVGDGK